HISKGLMKLGIQRLGGRDTQSPRHVRQTRARLVYLTGVLLNFSAPLWVMAANLFAEPVVYASMYASGLLSLLLFSRIVLHERLTAAQMAGAAIIAAGTAVLAVAEFSQQSPVLTLDRLTTVLIIVGAWLSGSVLIARTSKRVRVSVQEVWFGIAAGGFAALDAVLKGMAQRSGGTALLVPSDSTALVVLIGSFGVAAMAFVFIQWSYIRHCRASMMGIAYDLSFVVVPVLVFALAVPGYRISVRTAGGLSLLLLGVLVLASPGFRPHPVAETGN
ncbi:MAG: hypothetical protein ACOC4I_03830, partial [Spirochaetota bacterium]